MTAAPIARANQFAGDHQLGGPVLLTPLAVSLEATGWVLPKSLVVTDEPAMPGCRTGFGASAPWAERSPPTVRKAPIKFV